MTAGHHRALAAAVDAFVAAWEAGPAEPDVADHLPDGDEGLRRVVLVELLRLDLEIRRVEGRPGGTAETCLERFPDLPDEAVLDLVLHEAGLRRAAGEPVDPEGYAARFPALADRIRCRLVASTALLATVLGDSPIRRPELAPGGRVDDFDLILVLGKGTFATVFLARQISLGRLVALKATATGGGEPQTLARLDHPHIVRVHDERVLARPPLRLLYMEFVPGGTLERVVRSKPDRTLAERGGRDVLAVVDEALEAAGMTPPSGSYVRRRMARMTWPDAVGWIGSRIAWALDHAHRNGVLHRDVKPANVLLTGEGSPKLVDFNVSFDARREGTRPSDAFGGTLVYMSPEQMEAASDDHPRRQEEVGQASDLYSIGVVLWEMLTGHRPHADPALGGDWSTVLLESARVRRLRREVGERRPPEGAPAALVAILEECLAPDPAARPPTAADLGRRLDLCRLPGAERILCPPATGPAAFARRHAALTTVAVGVLPNALAAVFNFLYNRRAIVETLEGAADAFYRIQSVINSVAFPVGLGVAAAFVWPVARRLDRGAGGDDDGALRVRCLGLGHRFALLGVGLWLVAGVAYPVSLHLAIGRVPASAAVHFFASLAVCGLIAAAYPYFAVTFLSLRALYPPLLRRVEAGEGDLAALGRLGRQTTFHLVLATAVPMAAVVLLVALGSADRLALGVLGVVGLVGLAASLAAARAIRADQRLLVRFLLPAEEVEEWEDHL